MEIRPHGLHCQIVGQTFESTFRVFDERRVTRIAAVERDETIIAELPEHLIIIELRDTKG
jgi:hypothetical protein